MGKLLIFAGTTEGRRLAETLSENNFGYQVILHTATEYGLEVLPEQLPGIRTEAGRLAMEEMAERIRTEKIDVVVDATHPYAVEVSKNIRGACEEAQVEYVRLLRKEGAANLDDGTVVYVKDSYEAAEYLNRCEGPVLLTTGSKELPVFMKVKDWKERLYVRMLPMVSIMEKCRKLGFQGKQMICMQGPFSYDLNRAMLLHVGAKYLVTKDSGQAGGFEEKYRAAMDLGVTVILIGRPEESEGVSEEEVVAYLREKSVKMDVG